MNGMEKSSRSKADYFEVLIADKLAKLPKLVYDNLEYDPMEYYRIDILWLKQFTQKTINIRLSS